MLGVLQQYLFENSTVINGASETSDCFLDKYLSCVFITYSNNSTTENRLV